MDFDSNQFLTDVFEVLIKMPGEPVRQLDAAVEEIIADHVEILRKLAQRHRTDILSMAEERRTTGKMVMTRWRL